MEPSVVIKNVSKKYKMYQKTSDKLLDLVLPNGYGDDFYAVQNVSFTAEPGDVIGIIGVNGAGKSTLSNLLTGVIPPTAGTVSIQGEAALIAIAAGLDNQLTGRENIELKCLMLGFSRKRIKELTPEIIEFAELGHFIDQPVKSYSSGMKSRLGFAISVNIDPDVLVIDEALSVGDQTFTDKCLDKMNEFKQAGKTIFFISHSLGQVKSFCHKALWMEAGEVKAYGPIKEVMPQYEKFLKEFKALSKEEQKNFKQAVLERRSKERRQEEEDVKGVTAAEEAEAEVHEEGNQGYMNRSMKRRSRRSRRNLLKKFSLLLAALLVLLAIAAIFKNHNVFTQAKTPVHKTEKATSVDKSHTAKKGAASPADSTVQYVTAKSGFIRSEPSQEGSQLATATFGDSFKVVDKQKSTSDNMDWLKVSLPNGEEGWISSQLLSGVSESVKDTQMIQKLEQLLSGQKLDETIQQIGSQKNETAQVNDQNQRYSYNENNQVKQIAITLSTSSWDQVIQVLGEPQLKLDQDALLYHGKDYDYTIYFSNAGAPAKLYVTKTPSGK